MALQILPSIIVNAMLRLTYVYTTRFCFCELTIFFFYVLLTVHLSITLVNHQFDTKFYFIIRLLLSSTYFEQRRAHHQEVKLH